MRLDDQSRHGAPFRNWGKRKGLETAKAMSKGVPSTPPRAIWSPALSLFRHIAGAELEFGERVVENPRSRQAGPDTP